ncbi:hypothetical protein ABT084_11305 [Streptomyces sp. NPDC002138]|uniref:hypothetical protein n=1 Tax=Streptomyces sp. NPDC002138 TaxID=3154410 RepID=UPI003325E36E
MQHNEPVASLTHHRLAPLVSDLVGENVVPSYVFTAVYHDGAELPVHTDREQCAYTVSLYVDCLPEPPGEVPWPLVLDVPEGRIIAYRSLGEGLLYPGCRIPHRRPPMPPRLTVTAMFFHFVSTGFSGPLD